MDVEDFKKKYEQLKDNPMYKNFCSILDTKSQVLERTAKENQELKKQLDYKSDYKEHQKIINDLLKQRQELIEYLKEQINECKLSGNDEDYVRADVYEEVLNKIELYKREPR